MEFGVAIAQRNFIVGDIFGNQQKIMAAARDARDRLRCRFVVFPELTVCGYPPEDLLFLPRFVEECELSLQYLVDQIKGITAVVGHPHRVNGQLYNAASVIDSGRILATHHKCQLPNYGVFDEKRYFAAGDAPTVVQIHGVKVGIAICEDVWEEGPVEAAAAAGAQLMFALNGSPFDTAKILLRENDIIAKRARRNDIPIVYANLIGGQDELVFDGGSLVCDARGRVVTRAGFFVETNVRSTFRVNGRVTCLHGEIAQLPQSLEAVYSAITLGTRDYIEKNGFKQAVLGLSGGIDSALTLTLLVDAIGPHNVQAVMMPSRHTRQMSLDDARAQAERLDVAWSVISIEPVYQAFLDALGDQFTGAEMSIAEENIQARCRGVILMGISNKKGKILITTGNKSEVAVGYATLYGDMAGGFAPIKDVPKTMVYELARYRNERFGESIPQRVIEREPSAELSPNQHDSDSLPSYAILDEILQLYVEECQNQAEITHHGFDAQTVDRVISLVNRNEYKRRQAPPGVRVTPKAFGRDRRYPITNRY